jgi:hypothetical protein
MHGQSSSAAAAAVAASSHAKTARYTLTCPVCVTPVGERPVEAQCDTLLLLLLLLLLLPFSPQ